MPRKLISSAEQSPHKASNPKGRVQNFLEKTKFPKTKKALQRYLCFLNYYQNYVPRLSERLAPFYKMLKSDEKILVSEELVQQFEEINKALDKCCDLALQQSIPNKANRANDRRKLWGSRIRGLSRR